MYTFDEGRGCGMAVRARDHPDVWSATLPPSSASVGAARHFTRDALRGMGAAEAEESATLLVSELTTNAVIHARTPLRLSIRRSSGVVRVEVRDDDPTPPRAISPDPLEAGGRGIQMVEAVADKWGVNRNERGKTVWFELDD